ncbi:hypothetical protein [Diaminobutyricimonas sp. LJ205]|uniref:hypothetical protein n=1 Tax=Diaminobutyricimonas sp. LJ205 TaxID=2683590 RepID=UPI0012F49C75|nr:hypothetical protein [Diaminobutyricimonas sp. LJ205]
MRRAAAAALIGAASVLGLAACDSPMPISLFSEPQDADDVPTLEFTDVRDSTTRHLADHDGWSFFAAIGQHGGYCVIATRPDGEGSSMGCSDNLPVGIGISGAGTMVELVPDGFVENPPDGWTALSPNLMIGRRD